MGIEIHEFKLLTDKFYRPERWNKAIITMTSSTDLEETLVIRTTDGPEFRKKIKLFAGTKITENIPVVINSEKIVVSIGNKTEEFWVKELREDERIVFAEKPPSQSAEQFHVYQINPGEELVESADAIMTDTPDKYPHFTGRFLDPKMAIPQDLTRSVVMPFPLTREYHAHTTKGAAIILIVAIVTVTVIIVLLLNRKPLFITSLVAVPLIFTLVYMIFFPKADVICHLRKVVLPKSVYASYEILGKSTKELVLKMDKLSRPTSPSVVDLERLSYEVKLPVLLENSGIEVSISRCVLAGENLKVDISGRLVDVKIIKGDFIYEMEELSSGDVKFSDLKKSYLSDFERFIIKRFSNGKDVILGKGSRSKTIVAGGFSPEILETVIHPSYFVIPIE